MTIRPLMCALASLFGLVSMATSASAQPGCRVDSGARAPTVVELYTSEGCSSCPPADRWLSTLSGRRDVIALGFHVHYWDRLGWPDRFAQVDFTARQREHMRRLGAAQIYTPQVIADGRDWRGWPRLPEPTAAGDAPTLSLVREGDAVIATVGALRAGSRSLSGYWAVTEDRHHSRVQAGENAGESLRHDHVVRRLVPLAPWNAADGLRTRLQAAPGQAEHPQRVVFVVTDGLTQRPLQALALPC